MLNEIIEKIHLIYSIIFRQNSINNKLDEIENMLYSLYNFHISQTLTNEELCKSSLYLKYKNIRNLLKVMKPENARYVRTGRDFDGGYVMLDSFKEPKIAYSFGIADDISWELDMVSRGFDIYMYDHTIKRLPVNNSKFHYFRKGIKGNQDVPNTKTLGEFIVANGHGNSENLVLKMDVEGAEWDFLKQVDSHTLEQFSQIVFELHYLTDLSKYDEITLGLNKLNLTHQLVYMHINNFAPISVLGNVILPASLEVTYIKKSKMKFLDKTDYVFPTDLDMPCYCKRNDVLFK